MHTPYTPYLSEVFPPSTDKQLGTPPQKESNTKPKEYKCNRNATTNTMHRIVIVIKSFQKIYSIFTTDDLSMVFQPGANPVADDPGSAEIRLMTQLGQYLWYELKTGTSMGLKTFSANLHLKLKNKISIHNLFSALPPRPQQVTERQYMDQSKRNSQHREYIWFSYV